MTPRIRRFDPWGGVSRHMIEAEAKHVAREMEEYLRLSLNDLKEQLSKRGEQWNQADESLHAVVSLLPERDRLGMQCLLVRDLMYLLELYLEYVRTTQPEAPAPIKPPSDIPRAPFGEWLFES